MNLKINSYNFYLSNQGYYDKERYFEVAGIVTLNITELPVAGKATNNIVIRFFSVGSPRNAPYYNASDKSWNFDMRTDVMAGWIAALNNAGDKFAQLQVFEEDEVFIKLYLLVNGN